MEAQRTIAEKVSCLGTGLHSGSPVQLTLHPARANSGIVFRGTGLDGAEIPARPAYVSSTSQATTLARGEHSVSTVEHLMAALYASGIDNVGVEVDGPEVPVMDGSAGPLVYLIRSAGVFVQQEPRGVLRVDRVVEVRATVGSGCRVDKPSRRGVEGCGSCRGRAVVEHDVARRVARRAGQSAGRSQHRGPSSKPKAWGRGWEKRWWSRPGSNRRPPECHSGTLPTELRPHEDRGS